MANIKMNCNKKGRCPGEQYDRCHCLDSLLMAALLGIVGCVGFGLWQRYLIKHMLQTMVTKLDTMKNIVSNTGNNYDELHEELDRLTSKTIPHAHFIGDEINDELEIKSKEGDAKLQRSKTTSNTHFTGDEINEEVEIKSKEGDAKLQRSKTTSNTHFTGDEINEEFEIKSKESDAELQRTNDKVQLNAKECPKSAGQTSTDNLNRQKCEDLASNSKSRQRGKEHEKWKVQPTNNIDDTSSNKKRMSQSSECSEDCMFLPVGEYCGRKNCKNKDVSLNKPKFKKMCRCNGECKKVCKRN